jgi:hypothetical protein
VKTACFLPSKSCFGRNRTAVGQAGHDEIGKRFI